MCPLYLGSSKSSQEVGASKLYRLRFLVLLMKPNVPAYIPVQKPSLSLKLDGIFAAAGEK